MSVDQLLINKTGLVGGVARESGGWKVQMSFNLLQLLDHGLGIVSLGRHREARGRGRKYKRSTRSGVVFEWK